MRAVLLTLIVLSFALAGCTAKEKEPQAQDAGTTATASTTSSSGTAKTSTAQSGTGSTSGTSTQSSSLGTASLAADVHNGTAPLRVNFTLAATGSPLEWRLSFGDGAIANGTALPAQANHTFAVGGNFSANLTVRYAAGNATANVTITVAVPQTPGGPAAPEVTHFEFGESLGCAPDGTAVPGVPFYCMSFLGGPEASGLDGHWQALDERYWGLHLTSQTTQSPAGEQEIPDFGAVGADSDCVFTDAAHAIIGEANNGSRSCDGIVPSGSAFLFIYPYGAPALEIVVDFALA